MNMQVVGLDTVPFGLDPMDQDIGMRSTFIGTNVLLMAPNRIIERCPYVVVVDTETGERRKIVFGEPSTNVIEDLFSDFFNALSALSPNVKMA